MSLYVMIMDMCARGTLYGMTCGAASSCVYIGREGLVYKAVRGEVLTSHVMLYRGDTYRIENDIM